MNETLKARLVALKNEDIEMRNSILKKNGLYEGYDEEMEALHIRNADELKKIVDANGWPGKSLVGEEGVYSAFTIAQHAMSQPELQKQFLVELQKAVTQGEATPIQEACLEDRILYNQGQPGRYGMLFDWDSSGNLVANVNDESLVNERRKKLELPSLAEALKKHRKEIEDEGGGPPSNIAEHKRKGEAWARRVGWR